MNKRELNEILINIKNNYVKAFLGAIIILSSGCGQSVEYRVKKMTSAFDTDREKFDSIRLYFTQNPDSISAIFIDNSESVTIKFKGDIYSQNTKVINPTKKIEENGVILKDSASFGKVLVFLKDLNIHSVGGNEKFTSFSFNHGFLNCYSLYYRPNPYSEINPAIKVRQLFDKKGYWYFLLDNNWYFKKEKCL